MKKIIVLMLALCTLAFGQNSKSKFVVSVSGELESDLADVFMDEISHAIIKRGEYDLLPNDRQFKEALKKEWGMGKANGELSNLNLLTKISQEVVADMLNASKNNPSEGGKGDNAASLNAIHSSDDEDITAMFGTVALLGIIVIVTLAIAGGL